MRPLLEYRGSFRYVDQQTVERAIAEASEHLDDDALARSAIEGCVDVKRGGDVLDAFAPEAG